MSPENFKIISHGSLSKLLNKMLNEIRKAWDFSDLSPSWNWSYQYLDLTFEIHNKEIHSTVLQGRGCSLVNRAMDWDSYEHDSETDFATDKSTNFSWTYLENERAPFPKCKDSVIQFISLHEKRQYCTTSKGAHFLLKDRAIIFLLGLINSISAKVSLVRCSSLISISLISSSLIFNSFHKRLLNAYCVRIILRGF